MIKACVIIKIKESFAIVGHEHSDKLHSIYDRYTSGEISEDAVAQELSELGVEVSVEDFSGCGDQ